MMIDHTNFKVAYAFNDDLPSWMMMQDGDDD